MTLKGLVLWFSNTKSNGHFGESKVILSYNGKQYPINDFEGKYGMSDKIYGLPIKTEEEGDRIVNAINTSEFQDIVKFSKWGIYQTEWRMFNYLRKDFWKSLVTGSSGLKNNHK